MEFHGIRWNLVIVHLAALEFHGIPWNFVSLHVPWNFRSFMEFHGTSQLHGIPWNLYSQIAWNFSNSMEFHGNGYSDTMEFHGIWLCSQIPWNFGVGIKFHGTFKVPWNSMELPFWPGKIPWNSMELLASSMEFNGIRNIDINKFHNWGSVFHCLLHDFMLLYIRQSISSWNIEIFQFHFAQMAIFHSKWRPVINCF